MANVAVEVVREHENEFGDTYAKAVGDVYDAPENAAQSLIANKLCKAAAKGKRTSR